MTRRAGERVSGVAEQQNVPVPAGRQNFGAAAASLCRCCPTMFISSFELLAMTDSQLAFWSYQQRQASCLVKMPTMTSKAAKKDARKRELYGTIVREAIDKEQIDPNLRQFAGMGALDGERLCSAIKEDHKQTDLASFLAEEKKDSETMRYINVLMDREQFSKAIAALTSLISKKNETLDAFLSRGSGPSMLPISPLLIECYGMRAQAFYQMSRFNDVLQDTTSGIDLVASILRCHTGPPSSDTVRLLELESGMFETRGSAAASLNDLPAALADFRASAATLRREGVDPSGHDHIRTATNVILAMAKIKFNLSAPRPHYTPEERRALTRELQIHEHAPAAVKARRCAHCSSPAPAAHAEAELKACSGCRSAWYCGPECQRLSWPQHKAACRETAAPLKVPPRLRGRVLSSIAEDGCYVSADLDRLGPVAIMRDSASGRLFESVSDRSVVFT
jgi:hypothetical protein